MSTRRSVILQYRPPCTPADARGRMVAAAASSARRDGLANAGRRGTTGARSDGAAGAAADARTASLVRWAAGGALAIAAAFAALHAADAHAQMRPMPAQRSDPSTPTPIPYPGQSGPIKAEHERYVKAVVRVEARAPRDAQSAETLGVARVGSGVVLDERTVLTIGYLLLEAERVDLVTADGRKIPADVAGYDHATGFGLVRSALPIGEPAMELGDSDRVSEKQKLLTVGQGETEATELLVVSRKPFTGGWEYMIDRPIYTFPPVNNWSGAALISDDGKLVGLGSLIVNDAASGQRGVPGNLYVPVNLVKPIIKDLLARGRRAGPAQPWLGVTTENVKGNLMIVRVSPNGPADEAGLSAGDIIVGVGADKIADQADFYRRVWSQGPAGTTIPLRVLKSGDVQEIRVKSVDRADVIRRPSGI